MNQDYIQNRYDILNQVGSGAQGSVFLARNKITNQLVAIKLISLTPQNQNHITAEVTNLQKITGIKCSHYIVCYLGSFYDPSTNQVVIEMEYVDGPTVFDYTLSLRVRNNIPVLVKTCRALTKAMLLALRKIHQHGVLHNDIKPSNIVVNNNRVPVLADFGISCSTVNKTSPICIQPYNKVVDQCCNNGSGTAMFIAPESIKKISYPESDLWSLGATIYNIFTGGYIWDVRLQGTSQNVMNQVMEKFISLTPPKKLNTGDQVLDGIINSFLSYDPAMRMKIDQALAMLK